MKPIKVHTVNLNPDQMDSEGLFLHTSFFDANEGKGDGEVEVFATQELILNSYSNSASFHLSYYFNPDTLRALANQLEVAMNKAEQILKAKANGTG